MGWWNDILLKIYHLGAGRKGEDLIELASLYGGCSSVGRAPVCGTGGRGFESHHSPQHSPLKIKLIEKDASVLRQS